MAQQQERALRSAATTTRTSRHAKPTASYRDPSSEMESQSSETEDQGNSDISAHDTPSNVRSTRRRPGTTPPSKRRRRSWAAKEPSKSAKILIQSRKRKRPANSRTSRP